MKLNNTNKEKKLVAYFSLRLASAFGDSPPSTISCSTSIISPLDLSYLPMNPNPYLDLIGNKISVVLHTYRGWTCELELNVKMVQR